MSTVRVVIVDDHPMFRIGLAAAVQEMAGEVRLFDHPPRRRIDARNRRSGCSGVDACFLCRYGTVVQGAPLQVAINSPATVWRGLVDGLATRNQLRAENLRPARTEP